jgi:hypothetical protein
VSYQASHWARDQRTGSSPCKCVLLVLAEQVGPKRTCILAVATIAQRAELGRTTVIKALGELERSGLIARRRRTTPFGHRTSDEIELLFDPVGPSAEPETPAQSSAPGPMPAAKVHPVMPLGSPAAHEKVIEKRKSARASVQQSDTLIPEGFPGRDAVGHERTFLQELNADLNVSLEAEKFRAHARAVGRRATDWPAAFHGWVIRSLERKQGSLVSASGSPTHVGPDASDVWRPRMREWLANQYWNRVDWGPTPGREDCLVPKSILEEFSAPRAAGRGGVET